MSKFKIGERVVFYSSGMRNFGNINLVCGNNTYEIRYGDHTEIYIPVHEKQIRRLVKKNKEKLGRELWFYAFKVGDGAPLFMLEKARREQGHWGEVIHVREILDE